MSWAVRSSPDGTTKIVNEAGDVVDVESKGTRSAQAVSYPDLLCAVLNLNDKLDEMLLHLREITGNEP